MVREEGHYHGVYGGDGGESTTIGKIRGVVRGGMLKR
jgi:hypothetical protein